MQGNARNYNEIAGYARNSKEMQGNVCEYVGLLRLKCVVGLEMMVIEIHQQLIKYESPI